MKVLGLSGPVMISLVGLDLCVHSSASMVDYYSAQLTVHPLRLPKRLARKMSSSLVSPYTSPLILTEIYITGHLHAAVEDLRYQHSYHPVPLEQRSPALAEVLDQISAGAFGDGSIFEPCVFSAVGLYAI